MTTKLFQNACMALLAVAASSTVTMAATGNVPFTGLIANTCVLTVGTPGILQPNAGFTSLSSSNAGGSAGTIRIAAILYALVTLGLFAQALMGLPVIRL